MDIAWKVYQRYVTHLPLCILITVYNITFSITHESSWNFSSGPYFCCMRTCCSNLNWLVLFKTQFKLNKSPDPFKCFQLQQFCVTFHSILYPWSCLADMRIIYSSKRKSKGFLKTVILRMKLICLINMNSFLFKCHSYWWSS